MWNRLAAIASLSVVLLGPSSIRVDAVANPATAPVKGAMFMITARHHQSTTGFKVTGRAEGLVAGKRVTHSLVLTPAGAEGVFGVTHQWDAGQAWVLVFTVKADAHDSSGIAEAAVRIAPDGKCVGVDYPMGRIAGGVPWPRRVAENEIDDALRSMAKP